MEHIIPEVLSPAGDEERLDAALRFGADAVYLSGQSFGMRAACANFDRDALRRAVTKTHALGKKLYVTCNILPRSEQLKQLPEYLEQLNDMRVDAVIAADLAIKTANVELGFVDRFSGTLIVTGSVSEVEASVKEILLYLENTLGFSVCPITKT